MGARKYDTGYYPGKLSLMQEQGLRLRLQPR